MTAARVAQTPRGPDASPLEAFVHDVNYTRFDSRFGRLVPIGLAAAVGVIAANLGASAALGAGVLITVGLVVAVVALERDRWHAQDVMHWFVADRSRRWRAATGSDGPSTGDPGEAEVWLGTHQPGSVPQVYRAIAAVRAGNEVVIAREIAALPDTTPDDRAWRLWVIESRRLFATGDAEVDELRSLVPQLTDADDRTALETWLAEVDAARLHAAGDRAWLAPLVDMWPRARRVPLGRRRTARLWVSRFVVLPIFVLSAIALGSIGLQLYGQGERVPSEYQRTSLFTRGDVPAFDARRVVSTLPAIARSLARASRIQPEALSPYEFRMAINAGLPTLIWGTDRIDLAAPADSAGHHVWSIEVLVGGYGPGSASAIVTFDREDGPAYLYRLEPAAVASLQAAMGLAPTTAP